MKGKVSIGAIMPLAEAQGRLPQAIWQCSRRRRGTPPGALQVMLPSGS